jgi:hypothetical protein
MAVSRITGETDESDNNEEIPMLINKKNPPQNCNCSSTIPMLIYKKNASIPMIIYLNPHGYIPKIHMLIYLQMQFSNPHAYISKSPELQLQFAVPAGPDRREQGHENRDGVLVEVGAVDQSETEFRQT